MMNYFSALHKYDLEIRFHRRDLYQTSVFCGHVFTMKLLLKKINTWDTWQKTNVVTRCTSLLLHSQRSTPMRGGAFAWCSHFVSHFAPNAPTESCRCTTRIPWYHQNPTYTHRILFALTAWFCLFKYSVNLGILCTTDEKLITWLHIWW